MEIVISTGLEAWKTTALEALEISKLTHHTPTPSPTQPHTYTRPAIPEYNPPPVSMSTTRGGSSAGL